MFREIRGVRQPRATDLKRWFLDDYFDLHVVHDRNGDVRWFQLCYARDTSRERVLEWRRGHGFQHLKPETRFDPVRKESGVLVLDGVMPFPDVSAAFAASAPGLPEALARFVAEKIREYARPARRFRPASARTPRWIERMRERERREARLRLLEPGETEA